MPLPSQLCYQVSALKQAQELTFPLPAGPITSCANFIVLVLTDAAAAGLVHINPAAAAAALVLIHPAAGHKPRQTASP